MAIYEKCKMMVLNMWSIEIIHRAKIRINFDRKFSTGNYDMDFFSCLNIPLDILLMLKCK